MLVLTNIELIKSAKCVLRCSCLLVLVYIVLVV